MCIPGEENPLFTDFLSSLSNWRTTKKIQQKSKPYYIEYTYIIIISQQCLCVHFNSMVAEPVETIKQIW